MAVENYDLLKSLLSGIVSCAVLTASFDVVNDPKSIEYIQYLLPKLLRFLGRKLFQR